MVRAPLILLITRPVGMESVDDALKWSSSKCKDLNPLSYCVGGSLTDMRVPVELDHSRASIASLIRTVLVLIPVVLMFLTVL